MGCLFCFGRRKGASKRNGKVFPILSKQIGVYQSLNKDQRETKLSSNKAISGLQNIESETDVLSILIITWNMNGRVPTRNITNNLIEQIKILNSIIVAIGTQVIFLFG